jgi:hypothetical protein
MRLNSRFRQTIVFLTAGPIFPVTFNYDHLKIVHEDLTVIPHEGY